MVRFLGNCGSGSVRFVLQTVRARFVSIWFQNLGSYRFTGLLLLCKISVCGSLVQDLSARMSASGSCRTTCARSLYEGLLSKISLAGCLHQDPVGPLVQVLCMWSSCARSLCHGLCTRILYDHLCKTTCARFLCAYLLCKISLSGSLHQNPVGPLVQDLCMRVLMSASGSCRTSCARSLSADLLSKISLS